MTWTAHLNKARSVTVIITGMGKVNAAIGATLAITKWAAELLIVSGVAGALHELRPARVGIVYHAAQHDYGRMRSPNEFLMIKPGELKESAHTGYDIDREMGEELLSYFGGQNRQDVTPMKVASGDTFLELDRNELPLRIQGFDLVDMETAAVAQVAEAFGVKWLAVRAVSDDVSGESFTDFDQTVQIAGTKAAQVVREILEQDFQFLKA